MDRHLLNYLPPVLREVLEFQIINGANEPEISLAWDAITRVLANQFLEDADEDGFLLKVSPSKKKGKKAPEGEAVSRSFPYAEVKETKVVISFK